jgi:hypothetical protein
MRQPMTTRADETLLELHRELCAAVRAADEAFGRFYLLAADSCVAEQHRSRYRHALAQATAALSALDAAYGGGCRAASPEPPDVLDPARRAC